jgi:hypothetical protein
VDYKGTPVLQSDAAITHGNSGGPVFDDANEVIGIATFGSLNQQGEEEAGFNFFIPINTALEFVRAAGISASPGTFDQLWSTALNSYDRSDCREAISEANDVLRMMPDEPNVLHLQSLAEDCYHHPTPLVMVKDNLWVLYLVIIVAVVTALGSLILRRRSILAGAPAGAGAVVVTRAEVPQRDALPASPRAYGSIQATTGALSGKTFKITKDGLLIGRSPKCQIVLTDEAVSGEHAWIVPVDHGVVVIDRGSSNGTYVNSTDSSRVSKIGLQNGDRIYIGKKGANVFTYFSS